MKHVCVDAGAAAANDGIGRYLRSLLPHLIEQSAARYRWTLYARSASSVERFATVNRIRTDGLPLAAGRLLSLASSQPAWLYRDEPDLYWNPAHRFPLRMPNLTAGVVTVHDLCWLKYPQTMRWPTRMADRLLMPRALARADRIVAVSHSTAADLGRFEPGLRGRISVVHEAASPLPPAYGRERLKALGISGPYVLHVGTQEPRKNLDRLLMAFARVHSPHSLVMAGGRGWDRRPVRGLVQRHGLGARVIHLGGVDDETLSALYTHADLLAMPSLYEGFGLPLLEALSAGTPVLHGATSSMPEVAGDAGFAVDATSVDSIAAGLAFLLRDEAARAALAANATAQAAKFSWERAARETLAAFDAAIAARQRSAQDSAR